MPLIISKIRTANRAKFSLPATDFVCRCSQSEVDFRQKGYGIFGSLRCEVDSLAVPASGYLTHAQLCIVDNGIDTVVKEYWDTNATGKPTPLPTDGSVVTGTNNTTGATLKALFDSTHFKDSTMIVLKLKVWDSNGGYYDGAIQGTAKNRLYAYGNSNLTKYGAANNYTGLVIQDILGNIQQNADAMNYFSVTTENDPKQEILSTVPAYTVIYANSHGTPTSIGDCYAKSDSSDDHYLDVTDIQPAIVAKNLNQPPCNFAFLDACNTAGDVTYTGSPYVKFLASSFLNGNPSSPDNLKDRAFLGWKNRTLGIGQNARWTKNMFDFMAQGHTISDATLMATFTTVHF